MGDGNMEGRQGRLLQVFCYRAGGETVWIWMAGGVMEVFSCFIFFPGPAHLV